MPAGFSIVKLESSDAKSSICQRATFRVDLANEDVLSLFEPLKALYSSSFLNCVEGEERETWRAAIQRGDALWYVNESQEEWHFWFDPTHQRLLVMLLAA
ncbi:hypothetical protein [Shimia marina]|uniref:hypothetical protein n=1 Tax=Shimia marina TaxID=321267 RepID=UPI00165F4A6B|nr:hypothetical protein [Shimia marina]